MIYPVLKHGLIRGKIAYDGTRPASKNRQNVSKRFTLLLNTRQYLALNEAAVFEGQTMTSIVRMAIDQELRRRSSRPEQSQGAAE